MHSPWPCRRAIWVNARVSSPSRSRAQFQAKLGIVFEESDECVDVLEYLRDGGIGHDPALVQEARELACVFAAAVKTARRNTEQMKRT